MRIQELRDTLDGQILALDRNEDRIGSRECIERQQVERRRAIDDHEGVSVENWPDRLPQPIFAMIHRNQLNRSTDEVLVRRDDVEEVDLRVDRDPLDRLVQNERLIQRPARGILRESERAGRIRLGVTIDDEGALLCSGETCGEVNGRRSFSNAALLVGDGDHTCQIEPPASARM